MENRDKTWFCYDTDGDGEIIPSTIKDYGDYQAAFAEWCRRLDEGDYQCLGFCAAPNFAYSVVPA